MDYGASTSVRSDWGLSGSFDGGFNMWGSTTTTPEPESSTMHMVLGGMFSAILLIGSVAVAVLDYRWAPAEEKLGPKCQKPVSLVDFLLAVMGLFFKGVFIFLVCPPAFANLLEDVGSFAFHLAMLCMWMVPMCTVCLPVTVWCSPTVKDVTDQFRLEKASMAEGKLQYVKKNAGRFLCTLLLSPIKLLWPPTFVTTGKALAVLVVVEGFFAMCAWGYALGRVIFSAYTYKMFTFYGWVQEIAIAFHIKKRVLALDYPRFKESESKESGKVSNEGQKTMTKEALGGASNIVPVLGGFFMCLSFVAPLALDIFADVAFSGFLQFLLMAIAVILAEQALKTRQEKSKEVELSTTAGGQEAAGAEKAAAAQSAV